MAKQTIEERKEKQREYYIRNKKRINERHREHYNKNKQEYIERQKQYRRKNRDAVRERAKKWRKANSDKCYGYTKKWVEKNKDVVAKRKREYRLKNKDKIAEYERRRYLENRKKLNRQSWKRVCKNPTIKLARCVSRSIRMSLIRSGGKKNGYKWETLVGYSLNDLMQHLESQFKEGMSWNNRGEWHIDHVKPVSLFDFKTPYDSEFKECWSLDNLQPLWAEENQRKYNKIGSDYGKTGITKGAGC